jgi:hypothetical protein
MAFHSPTLLSYSHNKEWVDEDGGFNLKNIVNMEVEYVISRGAVVDRNYLTGLIGKWVTVNYANLQYDTTLEGKNPKGAGYWKITNIEYPISEGFDENLVRSLGKYTISYTRLEDGDFSFFLDIDENADLKDAFVTQSDASDGGYLKYLESIGDDFTFERSADGSYEYNHSLDVKFVDTYNIPGTDSYEYPIALAKDIAKKILDNTWGHTSKGELGQIASGALGAWLHTNTKKYFTESYDIINNSCSFSKSFSTNQNVVSNNYQYKITHDLERKEDGIFTITESGTVKGIHKEKEFYYVKLGIDQMIAGAFARCNAIFGTYISKIDNSQYASLRNLKINVSKDFTDQGHEGNYSIAFNNDIKNTSAGTSIDRTVNFSVNPQGFIEAKVNGTVSKLTDTNDPHWGENNGTFQSSKATAIYVDNDIANGDTNALNTALYNFHIKQNPAWTTTKWSWIKLSSEFSFKNRGKSLTWNDSYSINNPAIAGSGTTQYLGHYTNGKDTGGYIRKLEKNIKDILPLPTNNTYPILGWKELVSDTNQTTIGKRAVTVKGVRPRKPGENLLIDPIWPQSLINILFQVAKIECLKIYHDIPQKYKTHVGSHFLSSASCSFDSKGSLSVTCEMSYVTTRRAQKNNISTYWANEFNNYYA